MVRGPTKGTIATAQFAPLSEIAPAKKSKVNLPICEA